jgi:hypothetical protein
MQTSCKVAKSFSPIAIGDDADKGSSKPRLLSATATLGFDENPSSSSTQRQLGHAVDVHRSDNSWEVNPIVNPRVVRATRISVVVHGPVDHRLPENSRDSLSCHSANTTATATAATAINLA